MANTNRVAWREDYLGKCCQLGVPMESCLISYFREDGDVGEESRLFIYFRDDPNF